VSPADFIPVLEETGLIVTVGRWVIATACEQIGRWARSSVGPVQVAVNVSGRQFFDGGLETDVVRALVEHRVPAGLLELELTETSLMTNAEETIATLERLKAIGVQISIDDFGTGYSSLARLQRFPIDKLKIDIAFIRDITTNADDATIARAIISMAHTLKLDVIAEGVETAAQLAYLRRHHCDQIQGYSFSRPLPVAELEVMLGEARRLPAPPGADRVALKTLLLVDDDADALRLLQILLRHDGYHILSALSGAEGLELLALHDVQVVLCDQRMPGMSGSEFLDRVKDLHPDTVRIMVSAYADLESIMEAINRGAIYRFYKTPWEGEVMRENLRDAFRHYDLLHDTSPVLAAGEELERRNGELVRFASTAAHDLRQPLQVIDGFAALLARRFGDQLDDEGRECVAAICRGTRSMDDMVEGILDQFVRLFRIWLDPDAAGPGATFRFTLPGDAA
jgi:EAL domain-containing protein (putative c-di-GMP-specific phosphodiesterase class I)/CheY-like chemotaxis protein